MRHEHTSPSPSWVGAGTSVTLAGSFYAGRACVVGGIRALTSTDWRNVGQTSSEQARQMVALLQDPYDAVCPPDLADVVLRLGLLHA